MSILTLPEGLNVSYTAFKIANDLMHDLTNGRETWKYPIKNYTTNDRELAVDIARIFDYYLGGSEIDKLPNCKSSDGIDYFSWDEGYGKPIFSVSSRGYYHYIGA